MASSGAEEDDDPLREARAYNRSIYFMVTMPYLLFAAVGLLIYRNCRAMRKKVEDVPGPVQLPDPSFDSPPTMT